MVNVLSKVAKLPPHRNLTSNPPYSPEFSGDAEIWRGREPQRGHGGDSWVVKMLDGAEHGVKG